MTRFYRGQTLFGLLISLLLSSFLLLVIVAFVSQTQQQNKLLFEQLGLQAELQQTLQLIAKDLRRSGFRAVGKNIVEDNFAFFEQSNSPKSLRISQASGEPINSCLLFFYDLDGNGCLGQTAKGGLCISGGRNNTNKLQTELFGYRLKNNVLETRRNYDSALKDNCTQAECLSYLSESVCDAGKKTWTELISPTDYKITQFKLSWLAGNNAIQIALKGELRKNPKLYYETRVIVPLLNELNL